MLGISGFHDRVGLNDKTLRNASYRRNSLKQRGFSTFCSPRGTVPGTNPGGARGNIAATVHLTSLSDCSATYLNPTVAVVATQGISRIRLGEPPRYSLLSALRSVTVRKAYFKDQDMSHATRIAIVAAFVAALGNVSSEASARGRLYPVTRCGPDLAYLCPIHGYFDQPPFHYSQAVYPGCIKVVPVRTPYGIERRRAIVCGAPERTMVWW
jgi:hypothetical protein